MKLFGLSLPIVMVSIFLLVSCSWWKSSEPRELTMEDIQHILQDHGEIDKILPLNPDKNQDDLTINGIDTNNNQVRDYIENMLPQMFPIEKRKDINLYNQILNIIKNIQPTQEEKVIDFHKFYCQYIALPQDFKERTSSTLLQALVIDTPMRKKRFYEQAINTGWSLWSEDCTTY